MRRSILIISKNTGLRGGLSLSLFEDYTFVDILISFVDILVVWFIIYRLLMVIRGSKAVQLLKGFIVILLIKGFSSVFKLSMLETLTNELIKWGILAVIIIFQPEIRKALEELGRAKFFSRSVQGELSQIEKNIKDIIAAVSYMSKRRIGALIAIEQQSSLDSFIESGISIKGDITSQLLINIFIPNTPLHDGAVILQNHQVAAAGCYLPLSEDQLISKELGTRHRAAIGLSEVSDSITIIVSEETGEVSLTKSGVLHRDLELDNLESMLKLELIQVSSNESPFWKWGGRKNG